MILCWSTTGWSSPPKTGITTTQRTTAPPSTTVPGGTATATPPTLTASTCAVSTPPTPTASSGPPGPAGSTPWSSPRWRYDRPATRRKNETDEAGKKRKKKEDFFWNITKPLLLTARRSYLSWYCLFTKTYLFEFTWLCCLPPGVPPPFLLLFLHPSATSIMLASIILPPRSLSKKKKKNSGTIILLFLISRLTKKTAYQSSEPTDHCASFTQSDMVVQPSPAESHTSDFLLTCNSDLPSVLTWHLDRGSVSLPIAA